MAPTSTRQRRQRRPEAYVPRIDAHGRMRVGDNPEIKVRLIDYAPGKLAAFSSLSPHQPILMDLADGEPIVKKGRLARAVIRTADAGDLELFFQKDGCGCTTPQNLRGGRNALLREAGISP